MAFRSDVTIEWYWSPRGIRVPAPSTSITIQDLHDTLTDIQDSLEGGQFPDLIFSEGKAGGGVTGVVTTLQNAQVFFEPRTAAVETGTITTPDAAGRSLIDSTALFQTNGVVRGDLVENDTDNSKATVLEVVSETELETSPLTGGTGDDYGAGDAYRVIGVAECSISGGDLFAVDENGLPIPSTLTSYGVLGPIIEQSTSPAAVPLGLDTVLEGDISFAEAMRMILAAEAGNVSGGGTTTITIKGMDGTTTRIIATVDANSNRTVTFRKGD